MLIDTHCHLDAAEFDADRDSVAQAALQAGVQCIVVPAVERANFPAVLQLCVDYPHCVPALGIHPMYVQRAVPEDLDILRTLLASAHPVAVGEIGLDFFVAGHDAQQQEWYFIEQLKLAREFDLPVILHVRRAVDAVLKQLRRFKLRGGIAHAFNGSRQQAEAFIELGFKLGFGGAMTYDRALKIRDLAQRLPLQAIVLETDAPDIAPVWIRQQRNSPTELPNIAQVFAELRGLDLAEIQQITTQNAVAVLPALERFATACQA